MAKSPQVSSLFPDLYRQLEAPIAGLDCGKKCGPLNQRGVPFCCDTDHCVPAAYRKEWLYLKDHTSLWHTWQGSDPGVRQELEEQVQDGQVLLECLGHKHCQREYRTLDCRAFPFYPYVNSKGNFLGLGILSEYRDRCWVLSHLNVVTDRYRKQFITAFETLLESNSAAKYHYRAFSSRKPAQSGLEDGGQILLHRNGRTYRVHPETEVLEEIQPQEYPLYEPFRTIEELPFPDEKA